MTGLWTEDPRLAALYDTGCAGREDHDFYIELAHELRANRIVDIGCGTGVFAVDLAQRGHEVIGSDPAEPMLDIAGNRHGGDLVTWIRGLACDVPSASADLVVMMGHVAQYFVDDQEWADTLTQIRRVLAPGGRLTFETRNPARGWSDRWTPDRTTRSLPHPDGGQFTSWVEVMEKTGSPDSYRMTHVGHKVLPDGLRLSAAETLRYRSVDEITDSLDQAGFTIESCWGDWDRSTYTDRSDEYIVLARPFD